MMQKEASDQSHSTKSNMHAKRKAEGNGQRGSQRKRVGLKMLWGTTGADDNPTLQYSRAINWVILIDWDGSIKWRGRKKKRGYKLPPSQNLLFS
jgi:hypothetical protein